MTNTGSSHHLAAHTKGFITLQCVDKAVLEAPHAADDGTDSLVRSRRPAGDTRFRHGANKHPPPGPG